MLRIHDTMAGGKVELTLREPGKVAVYVCGPTVYDVPHLGHARTALVFDVIRRYLAWSGLAVRFVSNVTDVDDRIIARAAEEGSTEPELAARYEQAYWEQLARLGVLPPDETPHATEYVDRMLDLIGELVETGHAYVVEGHGVYFDVASHPGYGELSHRRLADLLEAAGARVEVDEAKRSPVDFALWKAAKPGEPTWGSPWGPGRPGWHIECSAMSLRLLGEGFDIHGGGDDLVFPHHENERAQAEAAGYAFARHWIHSGMVVIEGEKMSKSLGNFVTLAEALEEFDPRALRLLVLQTHYRSPMEMGRAELAAATEALAGLDELAERVALAGVGDGAGPDDATVDAFRAAMDDDLNTPVATGVVFDAVRKANQALDAGDRETAAVLTGTIRELLGDALGLAWCPPVVTEREVTIGDATVVLRLVHDVPAAIVELVERRAVARASRDFAAADGLRDEIAARGFAVKDERDGVVVRAARR
ncbi:MAG: cysteine--tRNA ligase [Acidimicrobiia bacterium]|nr:cysteine--tRNA ligase [Acidimicrobiia bacterium]